MSEIKTKLCLYLHYSGAFVSLGKYGISLQSGMVWQKGLTVYIVDGFDLEVEDIIVYLEEGIACVTFSYRCKCELDKEFIGLLVENGWIIEDGKERFANPAETA